MSAVEHFLTEGTPLEVKPLGNGLINDTFKVSMDSGKKYVLQRINHSIFRDVDLLMHNIDCVTAHIRSKGKRTLRFIPCRETGKSYWTDGREYWRVSEFIDGAYTLDAVTPESAACAGKAFGEFQAMLIDIPDTIGETIPDFHNMELRARQLQQAVEENPAGRVALPESGEILSEISANMEEMCKAERLHRQGLLPKRICHCDTKVNNMLFDADGNVICVIDLDTVMPSFVFSDIGDFLRTGASTVAEDNPDTGLVDFRMDIYRSFTEAYLDAASGFLTPVEVENIPYAACLFPFMQAVRFFADYLAGDTYYKTLYPDHNLVRTRNQLALFRSARSKLL